MENKNAPEWVDKAWGSTCRTLLGGEVGSIGKFEEYLKRDVPHFRIGKSSISGREIVVGGEYVEGTKFISGDEIGKYALAAAQLNVNDIKDIDSIIEALGESVRYCGNNLIGNCSNATLANRLIDSNFVHCSYDVFYSKYVAYSNGVKYCEYVFGSEGAGKGAHFAIKGFESYECSRVFECVHVYNSSDCFYCANVENCHDCLFSFNLRSKRRCIGNLELQEGKFAALKAKLKEEIAGELGAKGSVQGILGIMGG
ncbi:Uncharacterised protein [Candidatus Anstonella stagnisolia]|nr:Uncharacterised protein [Candidatus Anstonella stagnisolia]